MDGISSDNPVVVASADYHHLAAQLMAVMGLAFGNAFHLRCMHAVKPAGITVLLTMNLLAPLQQSLHDGVGVELAFDISNHPPQIDA